MLRDKAFSIKRIKGQLLLILRVVEKPIYKRNQRENWKHKGYMDFSQIKMCFSRNNLISSRKILRDTSNYWALKEISLKVAKRQSQSYTRNKRRSANSPLNEATQAKEGKLRIQKSKLSLESWQRKKICGDNKISKLIRIVNKQLNTSKEMSRK